MLGEFEPIYRAFARVGITPREVDAMDLWEIRAALGVDEAEEQPMTAAARLNAARVKASTEGGTVDAPMAPGQAVSPEVARRFFEARARAKAQEGATG